jgi:hypothetical protein
MMRRSPPTWFIPLDGVVDGLEDWHFPYFNDEMGAAVDAVLATTDTLLLGRVTYDDHAGRGRGGRRPAGRTPSSPGSSATPASSSCRTSRGRS